MAYRRSRKARVTRGASRVRSRSTRRAGGRRATRSSNVLRIVLEQPAASVVTRPGEMPAAPPRRGPF